MDAAGSERAALFGISEGGPLATLFAATYPDRTSALVLYGAYARMMRGEDYPWDIRRRRCGRRRPTSSMNGAVHGSC